MAVCDHHVLRKEHDAVGSAQRMSKGRAYLIGYISIPQNGKNCKINYKICKNGRFRVCKGGW